MPIQMACGQVTLSYLCCAVLGGLGLWLERKSPRLGRILQAVALALVYLVTYAACCVTPFRVIHNATVALVLLVSILAAIVIAAELRKSPALAGMALFLGYFTSAVGNAAGFALTANALLALVALLFLWRNSWVAISISAVAATYLAYVIWVMRAINWEMDWAWFVGGYMTPEQFRLRAVFLGLYWLLFTAGGLAVARQTVTMSHRTRIGLLTLNNMLFFMMFTQLMHHAYPTAQWRFQLCFGSILLLVSMRAWVGFKPNRSIAAWLFLQGAAVGALGVLSYWKSARLVAIPALD